MEVCATTRQAQKVSWRPTRYWNVPGVDSILQPSSLPATPPPRALRSTCVLQTDQPKLEEKGPFGYIKRTTKYDVRFSDDGSEQVTYRSWTLYDPVRWCERNGLLG